MPGQLSATAFCEKGMIALRQFAPHFSAPAPGVNQQKGGRSAFGAFFAQIGLVYTPDRFERALRREVEEKSDSFPWAACMFFGSINFSGMRLVGDLDFA
nr:hypothetical protein [uncultured Desulfobulbus sp.]